MSHIKDVASHKKDELDGMPVDNNSRNDILIGALNPLALYANDSESKERAGTVEGNDAKSNNDVVSGIIANGNFYVENSAKLCFRDDEHTDECEIFDPITNKWQGIDAYVNSDRSFINELSDNSDNISSSERILKNVNLDDEDFKYFKNDQKKPLRDAMVWGKGQVQPLAPLTDENNSRCNESKRSNASRRGKHWRVKPPPKLMRLCTQALIQWDMIKDGDRLLLGLSGGKDSLSLLHVLLELQKKLPTRFEIEICTIDPMTPSYDPSPLIPYVESLGLKYHYIRDNIVERASNAGKDGTLVSSLCAFCARMKRGNLYACARKNNCNKLVLAQHLDDLAESFMMSVMHNGFLRTMKANYKINSGDLSVIRPFAYVRESMLTEFAKSSNFEIVNENCPACFEEPKERARMKKMLSKEEALYPSFYDNIKRAILPLMHDDATAIMRSYTEEALSKSRRGVKKKLLKLEKETFDDRRVDKKIYGDLKELEKSETNRLTTLEDASEEMLLRELAGRRANRFRLSGSMARDNRNGPCDPTGQVCSVNGNDTIPCSLME